MSSDRNWLWEVVYVVGIALLTALVPAALWTDKLWTDGHVWALELFSVCLGVVLVSAASAMRQRIRTLKDIEELRRQVERLAGSAGGRAQGTSEKA